jgi:hypothetical protein
MSIKVNWDGMGILTSVACAIHCALLPLIVPALPLFGINIIHNNIFEWGMIGLALVVGVYSLYHGFKRHHHHKGPVGIFVVGMTFLLMKQLYVTYAESPVASGNKTEYLLLSIAVLLIITAHYRNYRLCQQTKCHSPHHAH